MRFVFAVAPIIAGIDKFLHLLTDRDKYLAPIVPNTLHIQLHTFMMLVGAVEIVAGLVVAFAPRFGGYLVAAWLAGIILNLVVVGGFLDVALRGPRAAARRGLARAAGGSGSSGRRSGARMSRRSALRV